MRRLVARVSQLSLAEIIIIIMPVFSLP